MEKTSVTYNYPILIGSIILQNSKVHMFNYLYKFILDYLVIIKYYIWIQTIFMLNAILLIMNI